MEFEITCDCGWSFRGSEDEVVEATISHGQSIHEIELSPEQARSAARPVDASVETGG
jgi:predicted small metal-binding protein